MTQAASAGLAKGHAHGREIVDVAPARSGLSYVGFSAHRLEPGATLTVNEPDRETCIVLLSGAIDARAGELAWDNLAGRASVFEDRSPYAIYVPPRVPASVTARTAAEIGLAQAPAKGTLPARLIDPATMKRSVRGKGANTRYICDILPDTEPAESLLVVEVTTPSGHSSSYPPHKHDTDALPGESFLEETYYHRIDPPQGFVFQRIYTDDRSLDQSYAVENHDVVIVPRGYHPVCVPYGYRSYYLNVMAGPRRIWCFRNDPAHEWMLK